MRRIVPPFDRIVLRIVRTKASRRLWNQAREPRLALDTKDLDAQIYALWSGSIFFSDYEILAGFRLRPDVSAGAFLGLRRVLAAETEAAGAA